jgi:glycoside/pentoside/hexuronide:cation symporter, GPH family
MAIRLNRVAKAGYGVADVGASLTYVAINTWLLYFLINIAGLTPFLAGTVFLAGRVLDAVTDPLMGVLSDRMKPRYGRVIFVRWGAVPLGLSFMLLWLVPEATQAVRFALALLTFILFSLLYTVVQVPYMALTPELATDYDDRTNLTSYRMGFGTFASLLAVALPPMIVSFFSPDAELALSRPTGWLMVGAGFAVITSGCYLLMTRLVKEPKRQVTVLPSTSLIQEYRSAFGIFGFRQVFVLFIVITMGLMIVNSILPFFLESNLRLSANQQSIILGLLFGSAILSFPLWNYLGQRLGKKRALALGLMLMACGLTLIVSLVSPGVISPLLIGLILVSGIGLSAIMLFPWAMLPDVVEFDEIISGQRREGLVYALFTFGQKLAGSLGVFSNALVATFFGYQQGEVLQSAVTLRGIALMAGPVAAGIFVAAIFVTLRFPVTRLLHEQTRAKLAR